MLQADGDNLRLGRGEVFFDRFASGVSTGERFLGNVTTLTVAPSDDLLEKYSSVEAESPLIKSINRRRTFEVALSMDEFTMENIALALVGENDPAQTQAAAVGATATITDAQQGRSYPIGGFNVTNVVVKVAAATKTLGTDYLLDSTWGLIYVIPGGGIANDDDLSVTFDKTLISTYHKITGGNANIEGALRYVSDNATGSNDMLVIPKMSITPEGETGFIQDEFGALQVKGKIMKVAGSDLWNLYRLTGD